MQVRRRFRMWWQVQGSNLRRLSRRFYRGQPHLRIDSPLPAHLLPCRLMRAPPEPLLNHEHPPPAGHGRAQPDKAALRSGTGIRQTPCPVLIRWQADPDRRERKRPRTGSGAAATRPAEGVNLAAASTYVSAVGRRRESRTEAHGGTPPGAAPPGMIAASRPTAATGRRRPRRATGPCGFMSAPSGSVQGRRGRPDDLRRRRRHAVLGVTGHAVRGSSSGARKAGASDHLCP